MSWRPEILDNQLIMPRFVIAELQAVADSADQAAAQSRAPRARYSQPAQQQLPDVDFKIYDRDLPGIRRAARRPEARAVGQVSARQGRHQRLQP